MKKYIIIFLILSMLSISEIKYTGNKYEKIKSPRYIAYDTELKSLRRVLLVIANARVNKRYVLEKNDKDIFKGNPYYNNDEYLKQTSKLLLSLTNELKQLNYRHEIFKKANIRGYEYICSLEITEKPTRIGYIEGEIFGTVTCSSEFDDMSRFDEIYLKKVGNSYYIMDWFIS